MQLHIMYYIMVHRSQEPYTIDRMNLPQGSERLAASTLKMGILPSSAVPPSPLPYLLDRAAALQSGNGT